MGGRGGGDQEGEEGDGDQDRDQDGNRTRTRTVTLISHSHCAASSQPSSLTPSHEGDRERLSARDAFSFPSLSVIMGKSQSKLSPEQLSDLQKNTYCTLHQLVLLPPSLTLPS
jgi:hypothetical protein